MHGNTALFPLSPPPRVRFPTLHRLPLFACAVTTGMLPAQSFSTGLLMPMIQSAVFTTGHVHV